jgi:protocatechuate 3,4-dioxygenase beta subunit
MRDVSPALRGAAPRGLLLASLALFVLVGAALWLLRDGSKQGAVSQGLAPVAPRATADTTELAEVGSEEPALARDAAATGPGAAGVRLAGDGRLSGRVLERESGEGIAGAEVELLPTPPVATEVIGRVLRLAAFGDEVAGRVAAVARTISGPDGSFEFTGLRSGGYFAQARGPWHVPDGPTHARVTPSDAGAGLELWVRKGGRVIGTVELPDGRPAAGVGVALRPGLEELLERARSGDLVFLEARTDAAGQFVIAGVPPGEAWALAAFGRGFALSHAEPVAVRAGEDSEVTLKTRLGATLTGRMVTGIPHGSEPAPGQPIAGARVGAVPHGLRDLLFVDHLFERLHAVSDAQGGFRLEHVPPGEVDLVGWSPGSLPTLGGNVLVADGSEQATGDLALDSGPIVRGRVVDGAGAPIEGANLFWEPIDFSAVGFNFSPAPLLTQALKGFEFPKTDAEGRFTAGAFAGEPPFEISVTKPGYANVTHSWTPSGGDEEIEIVLRRGGTIEGIVMDGSRRTPLGAFEVDCEDLLTEEPGLLGGFNPWSGTLVEHAEGRFRVAPVEPGTTRLIVTAPGFVPARTDELTVVEGETLRGVIVTLQPGATVRGRVLGTEGEAVGGALVFWALDAEQERERRGEMTRTRAPTADQVPGGLREYAAALGFFGNAVTHSGPDGSFELTGVQPGKVVVYATQRSRAAGMSAPVEVFAGQATEGVEVRLTEGATLHGTVRDRFGRPVPRVMVVAASPGAMQGRRNGASGLLYQGLTDAEGRYEIGRMAGGGYFVMIARGGAALDPLSLLGSLNFELVTVPEGERVEYDLLDSSIGATRVRGVVHAGGEPLSGGNLLAMGFENESLLGVDLRIARVRGGGAFEFEGLAAGEYRFQIGEGRLADGSRIGEVRMSVEIPDQPEVVLDLALPSGEIGGVVVDAQSGKPIANASLALRALDAPVPGGLLGGMMGGGGNAERRWSGEDGSFLFERLEAGRYRLEVGPPRWGNEANAWAPLDPLEITLREGERNHRLDLRLEASLSVEGVVRGPDGAPVGGARLTARRGDQESALTANARSAQDGKFSLRGLAPGVWDVNVTAGGFAPAVRRGVQVGAAPGEPLEITLERGVLVRVRVQEADGRPALGASARLVPLEEGVAIDPEAFFGAFFGGRNATNADGLLELGRFRPGAYRLEVQRGLVRAPSREVQVDGDELELRARF